ncbi:unnamed protein product [Paramecium sonneborni]|uniref:Kinesin-like protein n=1 Tax=Paramecium sonneborni TaxID=65129 RepID=A0A8S1KMN4_9CILI|nr:unnamed protein product [Paramecium sonneborni]
MSKKFECVRVVIRCRPLNDTEKKDGRVCIVNMDTKNGQVTVRNPKIVDEVPKQFTFDQIFDTQSLQENVYNSTASPIVESVLEGYNGTIFAYGQTGTGKTHTMEGKDDPPTLRGIIPRTFDHIFERIENMAKNKQFLVKVSFLELYNEEIRDLLSKNIKNKLEIRENPDTGVYIKDLSKFMIESPQEMREKLLHGRENRAVGATAMNQDSSRSHSLFQIIVETNEMIQGQSHVTVGKLNLVDLAGSERQSKTHATGDRLKEAININQSLTTLGNVISALVDNKSQHIPYRDSKLTRLLQDSLGGNTKTVMIANIGPADYNYDETISTLRYAHRAKQIKNEPKINEDPKDAQIRQFQEEILKLKQQLEASIEGGGGGMMNPGQEVLVQKVVKVKNVDKIKEAENIIEREKEELRKKIEEERRKIDQQKNLGEEEKMKLLKQLQEKEEQANNARETQQKLIKTIQKMEQKLVIGHTEVEEARRKEKELEEARKLIEKEKAEAAKRSLELQKKEEFNLELQTKYNSIKEELEDKTRRIKTLQQKTRQLEFENKETDEFMAKEIEDLQMRKREILQEVKLKQFILDYFIPPKFLETMQMLAFYNEPAEAWTIQGLDYSGKMTKNQIQQALQEQQQLNATDQINSEEKLQELLNHPNVYFAYTEEGLVREEQLAPQEKKKVQKRLQSAKKPQSAKKRPSSKRIESAKKSVNLQEQNYPKAKGLSSK